MDERNDERNEGSMWMGGMVGGKRVDIQLEIGVGQASVLQVRRRSETALTSGPRM